MQKPPKDGILPTRGTIELEERIKVNTPKLELIRGGLDGGGPPSTGNWLADLPVDASFAVISKTNRSNFMVITFTIDRKMPKYIRLWDNLNDRLFGDVVPNRFVNEFELVDIVELPSPETKEETPNG